MVDTMMTPNDDILDEVLQEEGEEAAPKGAARFIPWLIAFSLCIVFFALLMVSRTIRDLNVPLADEVEALATTLASNEAGEESQGEMDARAELLQAREQSAALDTLYATLAPSHFNWPQAMTALGDYDHAQVILTSIAQGEGQLMINGIALDETAVMTYVSTLRNYQPFERVVVQSITLKPTTEGRGEAETHPFAYQGQFAEFIVAVELEQANYDQRG